MPTPCHFRAPEERQEAAHQSNATLKGTPFCHPIHLPPHAGDHATLQACRRARRAVYCPNGIVPPVHELVRAWKTVLLGFVISAVSLGLVLSRYGSAAFAGSERASSSHPARKSQMGFLLPCSFFFLFLARARLGNGLDRLFVPAPPSPWLINIYIYPAAHPTSSRHRAELALG